MEKAFPCKKLRGAPILGADFMCTTKLVLDFVGSSAHFAFAPQKVIRLVQRKGAVSCFQTGALTDKLSNVMCGKLNVSQKHRLDTLIQGYPDVLTSKLGLTILLEYEIQLVDNKPVRLAPSRLATPKMQYLRRHINQLLDGVIEPSCSHYSSPMFLVPKPGGEFCAVVDFRLLNKRIAIESVLLPDIHSAFHWFSKGRYFTTLDLNQAYHQIPLAPASKVLTAF